MSFHTGSLPLAMAQKPPFTIESPGAVRVPGETIPRRHPKARDGLLERPAPDVDTLFALLQRSARLYGDDPAIGSRKLLAVHKEIKKVPKVVDGEVRQVDKEWTLFELSGYQYQTYSEYFRLVLQLGVALRRLGLSSHDKVHVFAATSPQWLSIAHACSSQSLTIVTAYDTLGEAGVQHSLTETGATVLFTDPHLFKTVTRPLQAASSVKYVVYNDATHQPVPPETLDEFRAANPQVKVLSYAELVALGEEGAEGAEANIAPTPPTPDDLFCIMYTSGSTGAPKGVPVTHAALVASVAGLAAVVEESVSRNERVLAYLPLAHIFELVVENLVLFIGATVGYGSPRTLTDLSMSKGCPSDLRAFRPTILVGVPQVWETVRKGVVSGVTAAGPVAGALFWGHVALKSALLRLGLLRGPVARAVSLVDGVVFKKVGQLTGGNLRFIVNGASAISGDTLHFLSMVLAPMIGGYGLTETCGNGALGSPLQYTSTAVGPVGGCVEMKLVSVPELGYDADPPTDARGQMLADPAGEMWLRGKSVLTGYYNNPEETAAAITADGWFRTGDIGAFDRYSGHVRIVDRLKNLVKLQGGEYIALEKLEAIYRGASTVQNVMVYAEATHPRPIAVVCTNEKALEALATRLGVLSGSSSSNSSGTIVDLNSHPQIRTAVLKEMQGVARAAGLSAIETIQGVALVDHEWTPASGLVTATQKLNRRQLKEHYQKEIAQAFVSA